jgi:hypothetical protein
LDGLDHALIDIPLFGEQKHSLTRHSFLPTRHLLSIFRQIIEESGALEVLRARNDIYFVVSGKVAALVTRKWALTRRIHIHHISDWFHDVLGTWTILSEFLPNFPDFDAFAAAVKKGHRTPQMKQMYTTQEWAQNHRQGIKRKYGEFAFRNFHSNRTREMGKSAKVAEARRRNWENPEYRAKMHAASQRNARALHADPDRSQAIRAKQSASRKELLKNNPELKEKCLANLNRPRPYTPSILIRNDVDALAVALEKMLEDHPKMTLLAFSHTFAMTTTKMKLKLMGEVLKKHPHIQESVKKVVDNSDEETRVINTEQIKRLREISEGFSLRSLALLNSHPITESDVQSAIGISRKEFYAKKSFKNPTRVTMDTIKTVALEFMQLSSERLAAVCAPQGTPVSRTLALIDEWRTSSTARSSTDTSGQEDNSELQ